MKLAQEHAKEFADKHWSTPPAFKKGDQVWLLWHNIKTTWPPGKLDFKQLGPFTILKEINPVAFHLDLPLSMKTHNVFYVSLLKPYSPNTIPGCQQDPPPPVIVEDQTEYEVDKILDSKILQQKLFYLVDWKGYSPSKCSWEPADHLSHCPNLVQEFHLRYPLKPTPEQIPWEEDDVTYQPATSIFIFSSSIILLVFLYLSLYLSFTVPTMSLTVPVISLTVPVYL